MSAKLNWKVFNGQMRQLIKSDKNRIDAMRDFQARQNLFSQIHSEVDLEIEAIRQADDYAANGYRS